MLVSKVIVEFTIYALIIFATMIIHELSHLITARILGEKGTIEFFFRRYLLLGLKLELRKYAGVSSFLELGREDKVHYVIIALAPYWLFVFGLWLIHSSCSIACIYAGYVIIVFHIINLPLEFISF